VTPAVDFATAVLERSRTVPVVVDFWAAWCGPCRVLGPVIESLAAEADGRWELVKVDTEAQPELARDHGVMGIPAVKMFHEGRVVAEFVGALPAAEIRRWLDANLPDPRRGRLETLAAAWVARGARVVPELEAFVEANPDLPEARLRLALAVAGGDPQRARQLVQDAAPGVDQAELAADVTALAELMERRDDEPAKIASSAAAARAAFADHDLEATLEHLVAWAMRDPAYRDQLARRAAVALFRLLGDDHDWTREYRRRLAMAVNA